jgi:serine/threonine protein kinase
MNAQSFKKDYSFIFLTCTSFMKKYKIISKIGEGHSANVFKIKERTSQKQLALKAFNHKNFQSKF